MIVIVNYSGILIDIMKYLLNCNTVYQMLSCPECCRKRLMQKSRYSISRVNFLSPIYYLPQIPIALIRSPLSNG